MPDPSHVGRRYLAPGQIVDHSRVSQFAAAVAGGDEVFEPGAVPPTYAAVYCLLPTLAQVFADQELGIDLAGLIHGEQSFEWPVPVRAGDVIDASAEIASVEVKRGLIFVTVGVEATNRSGEAVCRGRARLLIRAGAG